MLGPVWNWGVETGTHALRLIFGGVFDRFPGVQLILGHMGEMLPYFATRLNKRKQIDERQKPQRLPSEYLKRNILITTTGVLHHPALRCAIDTLGIDRVMFSVDYPFEDTASAAQFIDSAPLTEPERAQICFGNATRILKL